ncbi:MAG: T9SS type A sorting domain-containing protein [Candidatus Cloacimonetes bacterium]|nr:T9SS type A sorting domain-containing protein [Candidatus Cloacimonadota bacterium]
MKHKTLLMFTLLYFGIVGYKSLVAEEKIPVPGEIIIRFENHIDDDDLEIFISDYSHYNLRIYHLPKLDDRLIGWYEAKILLFTFDQSLIEIYDMLQIIRNDERVKMAQFNDIWQKNRLLIRFQKGTNEDKKDLFFLEFSQYIVEIWQNENYFFDEYCVAFDSSSVDMFVFLDLVNNHEIVYAAGFPLEWVPELLLISLQNSPGIAEFISDYIHYDLRFLQYTWLEGEFIHVSFNFNLIHGRDIQKILYSDDRVKKVDFIFYEKSYDPPSNEIDDILFLAQASSYVFPNPVRLNEVTIVWRIDNEFEFAGASMQNTRAEIRIYNVRGQLIRASSVSQTKEGNNIFVWDRRDDKGNYVASGLYFYRISFSNLFSKDNKITSEIINKFIVIN